jgi:hypothetical protein
MSNSTVDAIAVWAKATKNMIFTLSAKRGLYLDE